MPAPLKANELSRPLSLRIKQTTDEELRICAKASNLKIGETCRFLIEGALEMLKESQARVLKGQSPLPLPKKLQKLAEAQKDAAKKHDRMKTWVSQDRRSVRDETEDNSALITALVNALYKSGSEELKQSMQAQFTRNKVAHLSHRTKQMLARAFRSDMDTAGASASSVVPTGITVSFEEEQPSKELVDTARRAEALLEDDREKAIKEEIAPPLQSTTDRSEESIEQKRRKALENYELAQKALWDLGESKDA